MQWFPLLYSCDDLSLNVTNSSHTETRIDILRSRSQLYSRFTPLHLIFRRQMSTMFKALLISIWLAASAAFAPSTINSIRYQANIAKVKDSSTKVDLFLGPQIGFAAVCAGAVFAYVYTNIDSIKEVRSVFH